MKLFKGISYAILLLVWVISFISIIPIAIFFFMSIEDEWIEFGRELLTNFKNI